MISSPHEQSTLDGGFTTQRPFHLEYVGLSKNKQAQRMSSSNGTSLNSSKIYLWVPIQGYKEVTNVIKDKNLVDAYTSVCQLK